jgi:heat shock protein HslJ
MEVAMSRKTHVFVISLVIALFFQACSLFPFSQMDPLDGSEWELVFMGKSVPISGRPITIAFSGGEAHGSSGCNSYFGQYEIKGDSITFSSLAMTEMACMDPGVMDQEMKYLTFLSEVVFFELRDGSLVIQQEAQDQLIFKQIPAQ